MREGLMPTKYYEKISQKLSTANDQWLKIKYKLYNVVVCIEDVWIYLTFILVHDAGTDVILENLFTMEHFSIDDKGIHTTLKGRTVMFKLELPKQKSVISSLIETYARR